MADAIDIRIIGKDEASASLSAVRGEVRGLGSDAGGLRSTLSSLGGVVGTLGKVALGVAGGGLLALGGALIGGIGDARAAAQIMAQTEAVIKSTGGAAGVTAQQVADYAASLSAASGKSLFGDDQIQQSENLLLTFTNIKDKTLEAATAISVDMAQALGGEPQAQAIQLGKALNDPIQGISALTRVGVTFTDEQKNQIKTMQEAGDMAGAQGVILAELNKEFGGSAEAAAKADGGWAQFSDRLGELGETVGAMLLPLLGEVVGFLNDSVMPALEAMGPIVGDVIAWFSQAGDSGGALGGALGELGAQLGITGSDFQALWAAVQNVVGSIAGLIEAVLPHIQQLWAEHGATVLALVGNSIHAVLTVVTTVLNLLAGLIRTVTQAINGDWAGAWETLKQTAADFVLGILEIARTALDSLARLFGTTADDIIAVFAALPGQMVDIGADIIGGVIDGVRGAAGQLFSALRDIAEDALQAAKSAIGISSPSRLFAQEVGEPIVLGMVAGVESTAGQLMQSLGSLLGSAVTRAAQIGQGVVTSIAGGIEGNLGAALSVARPVADDLVGGLSGAIDIAQAMGADIIDGLAEGMADNIASAVRAAKKTADEIQKGLEDALDIGSPSQVMADGIGKPIIEGILEGMLATIPDLMGLVDDLGTSLGDKVADLAGSIHETLADMFDISASVDRQMAKNVEAVGQLASYMQSTVQAELDKAQQEAAQFENPEQAAKFFKLRSDQILELARLQEEQQEAAHAGDDQRVSDLTRQIALIKAAQEAERKAFGERSQGAGTFGGGLIEDIGKLFDQSVLGEGTSDALAIAMQTLNTLLGQLFHAEQPGGGVSLPGPGMNALQAAGTGAGPGSGLTVNVYGGPGQSEQTIADKVIAEIERRYRGRL